MSHDCGPTIQNKLVRGRLDLVVCPNERLTRNVPPQMLEQSGKLTLITLYQNFTIRSIETYISQTWISICLRIREKKVSCRVYGDIVRTGMAVSREESLFLERRLLMHASTVNRPSLDALGAQFGRLCAASAADEVDRAADELIREGLRLKLEFGKHIRSLRAGEQQLREYGVFESEQQGRVRSKLATLEALEEELKREEKLRGHRQELEERAALVNKQASRAALGAQLASRKRAIEELATQRADVHAEIEAKQQRITTLASDVQRLSSVAIGQKKK